MNYIINYIINFLRIGIIIPLAILLLAGCTEEEVVVGEETNHYEITGEELIFVRDDQIYLINLEKNEPAIALTDNNYKNYAPAWLPSQKEIIYLSREENYTKFWQLDLTNHQKKLITATKGWPNYLAVSPQGNYLLYLEEQNLYLLDLDTKTTQKIDAEASYPVWSPRGDSFVYVQGEKLKRVILDSRLELNQGEEIFNGSIAAPQFLNKNTLIFALPTEEGYNLAKYNLHTLEGPEVFTKVNFLVAHQAQLRLSPDKKKLIYSFIPHPEVLTRTTWIMNIDGAHAQRLTYNTFDAIWHPSSKKIYYNKIGVDQDNEVVRDVYLITKGKETKEFVLSNAESITYSYQFSSNTQDY